jgi:hypothetical protein
VTRLPRDAREQRIDQALVGAAVAPFTRAALAATGVGRVAVPRTLVAHGPAGEVARWRAAGAQVAASPLDDPAALFTDAQAAPGQRAVVIGELPCSAGAFGAELATLDPLRGAVTLATGVLEDAPAPLIVELTGDDPARDGVDVALAVLQRLGGARPHALVLAGSALTTLDAAARIAACHALACAGVRARVPSDDVTRAALRARGREADWRRTEPGQASGRLAVDGRDVPLTASVARPDLPRPVPANDGGQVELVVFGPAACGEDLLALDAYVQHHGMAPGVALRIRPGHRGCCDDGAAALDRLRAAGARVGAAVPLPVPRGGIGLAFGCDPAMLATGHAWQLAGVAVCARAAATGRCEAAREGERTAPPARVTVPGLLRPQEIGTTASDAAPTAIPAPLPDRGEVLARVGDGVSGADLLPWGPRMQMHATDPRRLALRVLERVEPRFAMRAHARGGGILVAGRAFGGGSAAPAAFTALAALGVRVVIAKGIDPCARGRLVDAGVAPLVLAREGDYDDLEPGHVIELPALDQRLGLGRPLVARNLTRGSSVVLHAALDAGEAALVRVGGCVAAVRAAAGAWR